MSFDLDYYSHAEGIARAARAITGKHNLTVQFIEPHLGPSTNGDVLFLRTPLPTFSEDEWIQWWGESYHEVGHILEGSVKDFEVMKAKKLNMKSLKGLVFNIISDFCQERYKHDTWYGRKKYLGELCRLFWETKGLKKFGDLRPDSLTPEDRDIMDKLEGLAWWELENRASWMPASAFIPNKMRAHAHPESVRVHDALCAGDYSKVLLEDCNTEKHEDAAESRFKLAERILDEVFEYQEPPPVEVAGEAGEGADGEGDEGEGSATSAESGEGEDSNPVAKQEGKPVSGTVPYEDIIAHVHEESPQEGVQGVHTHVDYSKNYRAKHVPWNLDDITVIDFANGKTKNPTSTSEAVWRDNVGDRGHNFDMSNGKNMSRQLERLLKIKSRSRYIYGQKKGVIHQKNLYRVAYNTPGYSERIFKRKVNSEVTDCAVMVGLDCSGSMMGSKFSHAGTALLLINKLLTLINVPHELAGFTFAGRPVHYIFKPFERVVERSKLKYFLEKTTRCMNTNADGEFILWSSLRLRKRREKRKIFIVLSDGSPTGGRRGTSHPAQFAKEAIVSIEKRPDMEIYGIGIMDKNVKRLYTNHKVVQKVDELEEALLGVIKLKILDHI